MKIGSKIRRLLASLPVFLLCFPEGSLYARESAGGYVAPIDAEASSERIGEAKVVIKRNYFKPRFTLFNELAALRDDHEPKELRVETPEGTKILKYNYITSGELHAMDIDKPVTVYPEGVGVFEGDVIFDIRNQPFGPGYPYRFEEELADDEGGHEEERMREAERRRNEDWLSEKERTRYEEEERMREAERRGSEDWLREEERLGREEEERMREGERRGEEDWLREEERRRHEEEERMREDERRGSEDWLREEGRRRHEEEGSLEGLRTRDDERRNIEELIESQEKENGALEEELRRNPDRVPAGKSEMNNTYSPLAAGITGWLRLWPKREVPFVIAPIAEERNLFDIMDAITWWGKAGIKFRHRNPKDGNKYIYFMKTSSLFQGSSDSIGMRADNQPTTIRIGYGSGPGLVAHEIGHALGLFHEQSRADRDKFVTIKWNNIAGNKESNFCKYDGSGNPTHCTWGDRQGQDIGPYQYSSIMHYGSYAFGKVNPNKIFVGGFFCGLFPFNPDCYKAKTWTMITSHKNNPSKDTIVANRNMLTKQDVDAVKELYKYADKCGGTLGSTYGVVKFGGANAFIHDIDPCKNRSYSAFTKDYMSLSITIDSGSFDIPASEFLVDLHTAASNGKGVEIVTAKNPAGSLRRLVIKKKLLPGQHTLKITNWLYDKIDYKMQFKFTPVNVPMDSFDEKNLGNSFSTPIKELGTVAHTPLIIKSIDNLTIHNPGDMDIFVAELPKLPVWNIEKYCGTGKGPGNKSLYDGYFDVSVSKHDSYRMLRTVIYKNDSSGKPILDPSKGFRPWGFEMKGMKVECPFKYFNNQKIYFSVEDCSDANGNLKVNQSTGKCSKARRHHYEIAVTFRYTEETRSPLPFNKPEYLPQEFEDEDFPFQEYITPQGLEFIINQGQSFIDIVPQDLKEKYGLTGLLDPANEMSVNDLSTGSLDKLYEQHFKEFNKGL